MSKNKGKPEQIDMPKEEIDALQARIKKKQLTDNDYVVLEKVLDFSMWVTVQLQNAKLSIRRLKEMIFGYKTEKNKNTQGGSTSNGSGSSKPGDTPSEQETAEVPSDQEPPDQQDDTNNLNAGTANTTQPPQIKPKGHGRKPATAYTPDAVIHVSHETLKAGDDCPDNCGGRLYPVPETPGGIIRVQGQSCAHVISFVFRKLRCSLCGETFTPPNPAGFGDEKYDALFKAIVVTQKYSLATPFYRQEAYQNMVGFPLPDATQWDICESVADNIYPIFNELEKVSANYTNINNDDTGTKILDVIKDNKLNPDKERTGTYTTCIFATSLNKPTIVLYYSSVRHSGENVANLLKKRDSTLPPIIQMSDALSANIPKEFKTILCNCLAHGRRNFVKLGVEFPTEATHVVTEIGKVYHYDSQAKQMGMSPEERLAHHQEHSGPVMDALKLWFQQQFDERKVEPNSGVGGAINYMQRHWEKLTRFLSIVGAHIDNNIVEQSLKLAIQVRKNSMFHKSEHGAYVAALFFTIIKTCTLSKINPINYLTVLQKNKSALFKYPELWLPWNYQDNLAEIQKAPIQEAA